MWLGPFQREQLFYELKKNKVNPRQTKVVPVPVASHVHLQRKHTVWTEGPPLAISKMGPVIHGISKLGFWCNLWKPKRKLDSFSGYPFYLLSQMMWRSRQVTSHSMSSLIVLVDVFLFRKLLQLVGNIAYQFWLTDSVVPISGLEKAGLEGSYEQTICNNLHIRVYIGWYNIMWRSQFR